MIWLCRVLGHVWAFVPERYAWAPYRSPADRRWRLELIEYGPERCVCCWAPRPRRFT